MNKIFLVIVLATGLSVMDIYGAAAQNKIGFIDMNELMISMPEAKKADSVLKEYSDALTTNANDKQKDLNEKYNKFVADSATMTLVAKDTRRMELKEKIQELSGMNQKIQNQVEAKRNELAAPIQKKALDAVKAVAKENGYSHVFPKESVYIFPDADDLIDRTKKKLGIK